MFDYATYVLPKKVCKHPLNQMDKMVDTTVQLSKNNSKCLKLAMELLGRIISKKH